MSEPDRPGRPAGPAGAEPPSGDPDLDRIRFAPLSRGQVPLPHEPPRPIRRSRLLLLAVLLVLLLLSVLLPHVAIADQGNGRWLIPTATFFAFVQPAYLPANSLGALAVGLNVTYLGLGMQQLSLVGVAVTGWVLGSDDINRWLFRILVIAGWMLALSAPVVLTGWMLMLRAGTPALLGYAWLPTLLAGFVIIIGCRLSRGSVDASWFVTRPELQ